jgi:hypothetical protein
MKEESAVTKTKTKREAKAYPQYQARRNFSS